MIEIYLLISIVIGAILVVDGFLLRQVKGKCGGNPILSITTTIEFLWAIITIVALYKLEFSGWLIFIPSLYITHNIFGWLYGAFIMSKTEGDLSEHTMYIPIWYVNTGIFVGLIYGISGVVAVAG